LKCAFANGSLQQTLSLQTRKDSLELAGQSVKTI
jgi:hypothetical protein